MDYEVGHRRVCERLQDVTLAREPQPSVLDCLLAIYRHSGRALALAGATRGGWSLEQQDVRAGTPLGPHQQGPGVPFRRSQDRPYLAQRNLDGTPKVRDKDAARMARESNLCAGVGHGRS
jgi:hypothetical protein